LIAGDYLPLILTELGQEGSVAGLTPESINVVISTTNPSDNLKQEGGETL